jgi:phage protein D
MADAAYSLWLNNQPATEEQLALFSDIKVDQAIGMAAEAELSMYIGTDDSGAWSGVEEAFAQPLARIRVEAKIGTGEKVALIDGPVAAQKFELGAEPDSSRMVLVVQDDSALLNREEKVEIFEGLSDSEVAEALYKDGGLSPDVDDVPAAGADLARVVVRRGTPMQLIRELASRHGLFAYVKPGSEPGKSMGFLKRPSLEPAGYPELLLTGLDRNVSSFNAHFDALRPAAVAGGSVRISDYAVLTSEKTASALAPLGAEGALQAVGKPARTLLARHREEQNDLDGSVQAALDLSTWAWAATTEVLAGVYSAVVEPHKVIRVRGVGGHLSGDWLISRVIHVLDGRSYRQQLTLRRNARSAGAGGGSLLPGGIF